MSSKQILVLSSHTLSDWQRCEMRFNMSAIYKLEPVKKYSPFEKGTVWTKCMEDYYNFKRDEGPDAINGTFLMSLVNKYIEPSGLTEDLKQLLTNRFLQYHKRYKHETWIPIVCEPELLKPLYEDNEYQIVWSAHPDLIAWNDSSKSTGLIIDHKTQAMEKNIYAQNNQALGYCWSTKFRRFIYNYTGLQTTGGPDKYYRRVTQIFTEADLQQWEEDTIGHAMDILNGIRDNKFKRSRGNCQDQYGICWFAPICDAPKEMRNSLVQIQYKRNEEYDTVMK